MIIFDIIKKQSQVDEIMMRNNHDYKWCLIIIFLLITNTTHDISSLTYNMYCTEYPQT